jgi:hypothetical protein
MTRYESSLCVAVKMAPERSAFDLCLLHVARLLQSSTQTSEYLSCSCFSPACLSRDERRATRLRAGRVKLTILPSRFPSSAGRTLRARRIPPSPFSESGGVWCGRWSRATRASCTASVEEREIDVCLRDPQDIGTHPMVMTKPLTAY